MDNIKNTVKKVRLRLGNYKTTFTNKAIDSLSLKGQLDKGQYIKVMFKNQRGIWLYWSPVKKKKKFKYRFRFERKDYDLDLGEYIKGFYGCEEVLSKLSDIYKKYKENGKWKSNPKEELLTKSELVDSQKLTIRQVIEKLLEYQFPRKDIEGRIASITARQHSLFLIGHNNRIDHLKFDDDKEGMCTIGFHTDRYYKNRNKRLVFDSKGIKSWKELWSTYPSGRGIKKGKEISLYDNKISSTLIDNLTPGIVERYLEEKERTFGYKSNILKALQYLWGFGRNTLKCFGDKRPVDPTSMKEGGVELKRPSKTKFKGSKHNNTILENDQIRDLINIIEEIKPQRPFQTLLVELQLEADIRPTEAPKLLKSDFKEDHILVRVAIQKNRSKGIKVKDKIIPITPFIQSIIDDLHHYYKLNPQYNFVPWAFPSTRINLEKLVVDPGYAQENSCHIQDVSETFELIRGKLGVDCSLKTLRKTMLSQRVEAERDLGKTEDEAIETVSDSTHPGNPQTIKTHYYKPTVKNQIKRAKQLSKVIQMKRDS